jgi:hypothetical protein
MRRSSNGSAKPYQPIPTRRASFNGGFEVDFNVLLQNDTVILEQQQPPQTPTKKSPRKVTLNNPIFPSSPSQKLMLNGSVQPPTNSPMTAIPLNNNNSIPSNPFATNSVSPPLLNVTSDQHANLPSNLYKTELCRSFEETGTCRYGSKCQFAHGYPELRPAPRHPKYKTEICKTFHSVGTCPYGTRCRFIHTSPSDNINWITADVDNPLFDIHDKNAPEFDRSPNTLPQVVPPYPSFISRLPPTPSYRSYQYPPSQINSNEPLLSVIRAEIPPRLEPAPRTESRTLIIERPSNPTSTISNNSNIISHPISTSSLTISTPVTTTSPSVNLGIISNTISNNIPAPAAASSTNSSNISTLNISPATIHLAAAITAAAAAITPPLPTTTPMTVPTPVNNTVGGMVKPSIAINSACITPTTTNITTSTISMSNVNSTSSASTPGHKHRLPVFRELCHQSSVERLQQQVLDFVFEKEQ